MTRKEILSRALDDDDSPWSEEEQKMVLKRALESLEFVIGDLDYLEGKYSDADYSCMRGHAAYICSVLKELLNES